MTTPDTVSFSGQTYDYASLFNLTGPELVKIHNLVAPRVNVEPTKRFGDKLSGVKKTWKLLQQVSEGATIATAPSEAMKKATPDAAFPVVITPPGHKAVVTEKPAKAAKAAKPAKVKAAKKEAAPRKPRGKRFVFPKGEELKKVREGTHRATLVKLLSREHGATFEQCLAATWADAPKMDQETKEKTCYEAMRLLHYYVGYGMRHLDDKPSPHIQIFF